MRRCQIRRAAVLAVVVVVGFTAAPVAAIDDGDAAAGDGTAIDDAQTTSAIQTDNHVPESVCTDVTAMVDEEVPYDRVIWVDDLPEDAQEYLQPSTVPGTSELPEDAQPPNVPYNLFTPEVIAGMLFGYAPTQCDVVDPNDPPYDPREDDVDPDGGADVVDETENGTTLVVVNGTLNRTGDGPGFESLLEVDPDTDGQLDPEVRINDGEKDYGVDPGVRYWQDGSVYLEGDVIVIGDRFGAELDCVGEECRPGLRGFPNLINLLGVPSIPAPSEEDPRDEQDETDEEGDQDTTATDEGGPDERTDSTSGDGTDADDAETAVGGDGDASDDDARSDVGGGDGSGTADGEGSDRGADDDAAGTPTDGEGAERTATRTESTADDQPAQAAAQGDGPGFGAVVAALSVLFASFVAIRRE